MSLFFWKNKSSHLLTSNYQLFNCYTLSLFLFPCGAWISVGFCLHVDFSPPLWKTKENEHGTWTSPVWKGNIIFQNLHFFRFKPFCIIFSTGTYILVFFSNSPGVSLNFAAMPNQSTPEFAVAALPDLICHQLWIQPSVWNGGRWTVWCGAWRMRVMRPPSIARMLHVWYIYLYLVDLYGKCRYVYHTRGPVGYRGFTRDGSRPFCVSLPNKK